MSAVRRWSVVGFALAVLSSVVVVQSPGADAMTLLTVRDEFGAVSYTNDDGTATWSGPWVESDNGGAGGGDVAIVDDQGDGRLRLQQKNKSITRSADLSGATSATLRLEYRREALDNASDYVAVEVSSDGSSWSEVDRFAGSATDGGYTGVSYDVTNWVGPGTSVRLITSGSLGKHDKVFFDNVEIEYDVAPAGPTLSATPASLLFGDVVVTQISGLSVTFTHEGDAGSAPITITSMDLTGPDAAEFSHDGSPLTLNPSDTTVVNVTFTPQSQASKSATLSVTHDGTNSPVDVGLAGNGVLSTLGAVPPLLTFGGVDVGSSAQLGLVLTHQGSVGEPDITLSQVSVAGPDAGLFTHDATPPNVLAAGESVTINATFVPDSPGSKTATLSITHSGENTPLDVSLSGTGNLVGLHTVRDEFGSISYSNNDGTDNWLGDWIENDDDGDPSKGDIKIVTDNGDTRLVIGNSIKHIQRHVDLEGVTEATLRFDYRRQGYDDANDQLQIWVGAAIRDTITGPGTDSGYISYELDISAYVPFSTPIRFRSLGGSKQDKIYIDNVEIEYNNPIPLSPLFVAPSQLTFDDTRQGHVNYRFIQLTHGGQAGDLDIQVGLDAGSQFRASEPALVLSPGETVSTAIEFAPSGTGLLTADLQISHDGLGGSETVSLSGTGLSNPFQGTLYQTASLALLSQGFDGSVTDDDSGAFTDVSADGQYIAFYSEASNLVPGDVNGEGDVFVHDFATGVTELVSVTPGGVQGDGSSGDSGVSMSGDGRYVAFSTLATNLSPLSDTNGERDVLVVDRLTGVVTPISVDTSGGIGNGESERPQMASDGSVVVFHSDASDLVQGDNNHDTDVFVRDLGTDTTSLVSRSSSGSIGNADSVRPTVSDDGNLVAFISAATNLGPPTSAPSSAYVVDRQTDAVTQVRSGSFLNGNETSVADAWISGDGSILSFECWCIAYPPVAVWRGGLVHDLGSGSSTVLPRDFNGKWLGAGPMSSDGRYLVTKTKDPFVTTAEHVYVYDTVTGELSLISRVPGWPDGTTWSANPGPDNLSPSISDDGSTVAFPAGTLLVPGPNSGRFQLYAGSNSELLSFGAASFGRDGYGEWRMGTNVGLRSYVRTDTDFAIPVVGPNLTMARTYNSSDSRVDGFGPGWTHPYAMTVQPGRGTDKVVVYPDGRREIHTSSGGGTYSPPEGYFSTLVDDGTGGHTLTLKVDLVYTFDSTGRLMEIADANGRTQVIARDGAGYVQTVMDVTSGRSLTFTWTGEHITRVETDPVTGQGTLAWAYYYDANGRLAEACDPRDNTQTTGICWTYGYNANGLLDQVVKPEGNTDVSIVYDASKLVESVTDGEGNITNFQQGATRSRVDVTDGRGNTTTEIYDNSFRVVQTVDPTFVVTTYGYDADGNRDEVIDGNNNKSGMTYDARGNLTSITNPESETTFFEYDANDNLVAVRDGRSSGPTDDTYKVGSEYDVAGNKTAQVDPLGNREEWDYTDGSEAAVGGGTVPAGLIKKQVPPRGNEVGAARDDYATTYEYFSNGDMATITTPGGLITTFVYDEVGRGLAETITDPVAGTTATVNYLYDKAGNELTVTGQPFTNQISGVTHQPATSSTYDTNSNPTQILHQDLTGGDGSRTIVLGYDLNDRETSITDPEQGVLSREYDEVGNVIRVTDQEGRITETTYDNRNTATSVILKAFDDGLGGATRDITLSQIAYDPAGRKTQETDAEGRVTEWTFDDADRLTKVELIGYENLDVSTRDVLLNETTYDAAGNPLTERIGSGVANQRLLTNVYDAIGRLESTVTTVDGVPRTLIHAYDTDGNLTSLAVTDGTRTETTQSDYDEAGRLISAVVDPGGLNLATTFTYDARGNQTSVTDPRGNAPGATAADYTSTTQHDEFNRPSLLTSPPIVVEENGVPPSTTSVTTEIGYDTFGNQTAMRDPRSFATVTTYDKLDRVTRIDHPTYTTPDLGSGSSVLAPHEEFTYDKVGNLKSQTSRRGFVTDFDYDDLNRPVRQTDPLVSGEGSRGLTTREYDDVGNRTATVDPRGARTEWTYDQLNRVRTQVDVVRLNGGGEDRFTWTYDYDDLGNRTLGREPSGAETAYLYNEASELESETDPLADITTYDHDLIGRQIRVTDRVGRITETDYDLTGRLVEQRNVAPGGSPILATTLYGYDEVANLTTVTSPRGFNTTNTYDAASRVSSVTQDVSATESIITSFGYDAVGNLTRLTDGRLTDFKYSYNSMGLQEETIEPTTATHPAPTDRTWTIAYNSGGLATSELQPGGVLVTRTFDELGRLATEAGIGGGAAPATRTLGYDLIGNLTSVSHPAGTQTLTYDDRALLLTSNGPAGTSDFTYDGNRRVTERNDPAGQHLYTWTPRSELDTGLDPLTSTTIDYTWTAAAQLDSMTYGATGIDRTYTYDDQGRVDVDTLAQGATVLQNFDYAYDLDGNVSQRTVTAAGNPENGVHDYTYDRSGRLTSWNPPANPIVNYDWDDSGNRTSAGTDNYTYDERNRLVSGPNGSYTYEPRGTLSSVSGATTISYGFDALGRLVDYDGQVAYSYDALDRVATRNGTNFQYAGTQIDPSDDGTFTYSRSPSGRLLAQTDGSETRFLGSDRHGDITALFDTAGTVSDTRLYDPFGEVAGATGATNPTLGFQGDFTDPASQEVWMGARWYSGADSVFRSRDVVFGEMRTPVTLNRYTYAWASPLNYWDPDGRFGLPLLIDPLIPLEAVAHIISETTEADAPSQDDTSSTPEPASQLVLQTQTVTCARSTSVTEVSEHCFTYLQLTPAPGSLYPPVPYAWPRQSAFIEQELERISDEIQRSSVKVFMSESLLGGADIFNEEVIELKKEIVELLDYKQFLLGVASGDPQVLDPDGPNAAELLALGVQAIKTLPDYYAGLENLVEVKEYSEIPGNFQRLDRPKIRWTIDESKLPKHLQGKAAAAWAKSVARKFKGTSAVLAFATDVPDYFEAADEAGFVGVVWEVGQTSAGLGGALAGGAAGARVACKGPNLACVGGIVIGGFIGLAASETAYARLVPTPLGD